MKKIEGETETERAVRIARTYAQLHYEEAARNPERRLENEFAGSACATIASQIQEVADEASSPEESAAKELFDFGDEVHSLATVYRSNALCFGQSKRLADAGVFRNLLPVDGFSPFENQLHRGVIVRVHNDRLSSAEARQLAAFLVASADASDRLG